MDANRKKIILVIDDDPVMLNILASILSTDYHVKTARDGATGLVLTNKYDVDLIMLDLVVKDMSGFDFLRQIKAGDKTKDIPVIFITSTGSSGEEIKALSSGAVDYIRKPLVSEVVRLRVGLHLQLIDQMRRIERFSLTDGLTGVNNRRCFDQQLEAEWNRAARSKQWLGMLMMDIDRFKTFNDSYGHLNGDLALKTVAQVLVKTVRRGSDYVFRWGGEEFAVLLPDTHLEGAKIVAEKIRTNIAETPIILEQESVNITISIGVSSIVPKPISYPKAVMEFTETLDGALYKAKNNGRNRVEVV